MGEAVSSTSLDATVVTLGLMDCERAEYEAGCRTAADWLEKRGIKFSIEFEHVCFTVDSITKLLEDGRAGALLVVPRLTTWSRLGHVDPTGPRPCRSKAWPWGLPGIDASAQRKVDEENELVRHCLKLAEQAAQRGEGSSLFFVATEDLGKARTTEPASLWQLRALRHVARAEGLRRMAFHQCHLGPSPWPRPTGVLSTHSLPAQTSRLGWPKVNLASDSRYSGPLERRCHCGQQHSSMLKRGGDYKSPARNLSTSSLRMLAAATVNSIVYEAAGTSEVAESLLKEGVDTYIALREDGWVPESQTPGDQTEDEEDLRPPGSDSGEELESAAELDADFDGKYSREIQDDSGNEEAAAGGAEPVDGPQQGHHVHGIESELNRRIFV